MLYLFVLLLILVALAIATCLGVSRLEAAHPPTGDFVDVEGVRLHVESAQPPRSWACVPRSAAGECSPRSPSVTSPLALELTLLLALAWFIVTQPMR